MPKTKTFDTLKVKAHTVKVDDRMEVAGKMYQVQTSEPLGFGSRNHSIILRPVKVDTYHEDVRLALAPLTKVTIFRLKKD